MKINKENLNRIWEIDLPSLPNATFESFIDDKTFKFEIRTFIDGKTVISIFLEDIVIVESALINIFDFNIAFYSNFKDGVFWFETLNPNNRSATFEDFGNNIRFFYGSF